jgi:hypothetical protein
MKVNRPIQNKIWRLLLRVVRLFPPPEIHDLLRDAKLSQLDIDAQVAEAIESIQKRSALVMRLEDSNDANTWKNS